MAARTDVEGAILGGLVAYAAGDALGVPWEGAPPAAIPAEWAPGATSDDTALTLLVAEHLVGAGGTGDPLAFLAVLAERADGIAGLGPSTTAAVEHFRRTGTPPDAPANTNGAPMRALPIGWSLPAEAAAERRGRVLALTAVTHGGGDALAAAAVAAACAAAAVDGAAPDDLLAAARAEEPASPRLAVALEALAAGRWRPPEGGVGLDPVDTVAAVLFCCRAAAGSPADGLVAAVRLGGDTDTTAALVGGLLGTAAGIAAVETALPWLDQVGLPDRDRLAALAAGLAALRRAG